MPTTTSVSVTPRTSAALPMAGMVKMSAARIPIAKNAFLMMTPFRKNKIHSDFKLQHNKKWVFDCQCKKYKWLQDLACLNFSGEMRALMFETSMTLLNRFNP
jgi:hypothetical protein